MELETQGLIKNSSGNTSVNYIVYNTVQATQDLYIYGHSRTSVTYI